MCVSPCLMAQVGCGADELIDLLMRCVLEPGDCIIDTPPTFTMYAFDADINDARVITVPRMAGFAIDVPGIKRAVEEHKCVFQSCSDLLASGLDSHSSLHAPVCPVPTNCFCKPSNVLSPRLHS